MRLGRECLVLDDEHPDRHDGTVAASCRTTLELGAAEVAGADIDPAVVAPRDLHDQRQPDAPPDAAVPEALVVQPRSRTCAASASLSPGPLSPTESRSRSARALEAYGDPPLGPAGDRVEGVVDEVAEHGDQVARDGTSGPSTRDLPGDGQLDPALGGLGVLPSSSAATTGSPTAPTTRSVSSWATWSSSVANSTASSARPISISDTTVCSRLAASWVWERSDVGEAADRVELAGHRPQLGVVAQGDHGADLAALPGGRGRADHQHVVAAT